MRRTSISSMVRRHRRCSGRKGNGGLRRRVRPAVRCGVEPAVRLAVLIIQHAILEAFPGQWKPPARAATAEPAKARYCSQNFEFMRRDPSLVQPRFIQTMLLARNG